MANAFFLDLQAANLLKDQDIGDISGLLLDKSKVTREKQRVKTKSNIKHAEDHENLLCIGVDGKVDNNTLMYCEVNDEEGNVRLKRETGKEHHMTVTKESGEGSGTYLTHRDLPVEGATGDYQ